MAKNAIDVQDDLINQLNAATAEVRQLSKQYTTPQAEEGEEQAPAEGVDPFAPTQAFGPIRAVPQGTVLKKGDPVVAEIFRQADGDKDYAELMAQRLGYTWPALNK